MGLAAIEGRVNRSILQGITTTDKNCYRSDRLAHHKRAALTKVFLSKLVFTIRYTATLFVLLRQARLTNYLGPSLAFSSSPPKISHLLKFI